MEINKLQILEKQIRKDLPRLMEVSEGCYLKNYGSGKMYRVMGREGEICFLQDINNLKSSSLEITESTAINYFEVIGHNILLNDVLEWIAKQNEGLHLDIEYEVKDNLLKIIVRQDIDDVYSDFSKTYTEYYIWDLSKISLADQSDELKEFLYELIDEEDENY